jgi:predicted phosphate transport protein (TIGR00153 family)
MAILFRTTKQLEAQIDDFLNAVNEGALVFKHGVKNYLEKNQKEFADRIRKISKLEAHADDLRRVIETQLYEQTLIPEHRGDVLGILESTDTVIDTMKETLYQFDVETPEIPDILDQFYIELTEMSTQSTENLVIAIRAFFRDVKTVKDYLHKVIFYEKEADRIGDNLKREVFKMDLDLAHKFHLRYFALHIQNVSDRSEEVADRLAIYTIKRSM